VKLYYERIVKVFPLYYNVLPLKSNYTFEERVQKGRAIAQVVSRRLPTAAVRVRSQARSCGICGGQSGTGAGFPRVLRFFLPILIPLNGPYSSIIRGWYNRANSGRCSKWTQSHPTPRNQTKGVGPFLKNCQFLYLILLWRKTKLRDHRK
jgi:hypothetical protein